MALSAFQLGSNNITEKILWTNPDTSAAFDSQTINIPGLSNYPYVVLTFTNAAQLRLYPGNVTAAADCIESGKEAHVRYIRRDGDNIVFGQCYYFNHIGHDEWSGYSNNNCVPLNVFALTAH